jgi:hypothetical protein
LALVLPLLSSMKKYFVKIAACLFLFLSAAQSQTIEFNQNLTVNKVVLEYKTPKIDTIIDFISSYHEILFMNDRKAFDFYTKDTRENYLFPDYFLRQQFAGYDISKIKPNILNISKPDSNYRTVQVGYSYYDSINKNINVFCVYTFALTKENDSLKLFPLVNTCKFRQTKNEFITYNNIDTTTNNDKLLDSLTNYNLKLAKVFNVSPIKFTCYQFENFAELNLAIGFDVPYHYIRIKKNAYADMFNHIIYSTGIKDYFHELVHLYIGNQYVETCNEWVNEGLATYWGGSYLSLKEHLKNLNVDLKKHPEYDLNDFFKYKTYHIDLSDKKNLTSYEYTLGGLICMLTYDKKGFQGLQTLMNAGNDKENVYQAIEKTLGVKRQNFNSFFRKEISKY